MDCSQLRRFGSVVRSSASRKKRFNFNEFEVMANIDLLKERFCSYDKMYSQELREQTFVDWPFREDCKCTPEKVKQLHLCSK